MTKQWKYVQLDIFIFGKSFRWDISVSPSFSFSLLFPPMADWAQITISLILTSSRVFSWLGGIWIADCSLLSSLSSSGSGPRHLRGCWCRTALCCRGSSGDRPPQTRGGCSGSISHLSHKHCDTLGGWGWRPDSLLPCLHTSRASDGKAGEKKHWRRLITEVLCRKKYTFLLYV